MSDLTLRDKLQAEFAFFHSCDPSKVAKILARLELYKLTMGLPGKLAEFGVFHGSSLCQFAIFRSLFGLAASKQIVAFDTFGVFPHPQREDDQEARARFVEALGEMSIDIETMRSVLKRRNFDSNLELVAGDINETLPAYLAEHPETRFSLLHLDTDLYEPAWTVLTHCWPRLVSGGVLDGCGRSRRRLTH